MVTPMATLSTALTAIRTNAVFTPTTSRTIIDDPLLNLVTSGSTPVSSPPLLLFAPLHAAIPHLHLHQLHLHYARPVS